MKGDLRNSRRNLRGHKPIVIPDVIQHIALDIVSRQLVHSAAEIRTPRINKIVFTTVTGTSQIKNDCVYSPCKNIGYAVYIKSRRTICCSTSQRGRFRSYIVRFDISVLTESTKSLSFLSHSRFCTREPK